MAPTRATLGRAALAAAALLAAPTLAQVSAPSSVTAVATEGTLSVSWVPTDNGAATSYTVNIDVDHPQPGSIPNSWSYFTDFTSSGLPAEFTYTSNICTWGYNPGCGVTAPSQVTGNGFLNMTAPQYSYHDQYSQSPSSMPISQQMYARDYGRQGVGYVGLTGAAYNGHANPSNQVVFATSITQIGTSSISGYGYSSNGFVVYDTDAYNQPRWLLRYYLYWYGPQSYNYLYYNYHNSQNYYNWNYYAWGFAPTQLPMDLYLIRDGTTSPKMWRFAYSWPAEKTITNIVETGYSLYDSYFWPYNSGSSVASWKVGLFVDSWSSFIITTSFDYFGYMPLTASDISSRAAWYKYWGGRNTTVRNSGICAVSRSVSKKVSAPATNAEVRDLMLDASYKVSVSASNGVTTSAATMATGAFTPAMQIPVAGMELYLDANALGASASSGLQTWKDITGRYSFEAQTNPRPRLKARSRTQQYQAMRFDYNDYSVTTNDQALGMDAGFTNHETHIFMVYQPDNPTQYTGSTVLSRGGYLGYGESGYFVSGYSYYYTWNWYTYTYGYYFNFGARFVWSDYTGVSVGSTFGGGGYTWPPTSLHPHASGPTLLTYSYFLKPSTVRTYRLEGCAGVTSGASTDQCTGNPGTYWANEYYASGYAQTTGNERDYNGWGNWPQTNQVLRIGAQGYTYGWYGWYYYYTTDKYYGDLSALMIFKRSMSASEKQRVQGYLADRYYLRCPAPVRARGTTGTCNDGNTGTACTLACDASGSQGFRFSRVGGSTNLRCMQGAYVGKNLQCGVQCPTIASPPDYGTCSKYLVWDTFDYPANSPFNNLTMYDTAPVIPTLNANRYWSTNAAGQLVGNAPANDDACSNLDPTALIVNQPSWLSNMRLTDPLNVETMIKVEPGVQAGIIFRAITNQTFYRFSIVGDGYSKLEKIVAATTFATRWKNSSAYLTNSNTWYQLRVSAQIVNQADLNNVIIVSINDTVVWNVTDSDIPSGSAGLHSVAGKAIFDNFGISTVCDSNGDSCQNMFGGMDCRYTCKPGFGLSGNARQRCNINGTLDSGALECVPLPPIVPPQIMNISEAAPINAVAGVIKATAAGAGQVLLYELLPAGNNETIRDRFGRLRGSSSEVFRAGTCSGEIILNQAGVLSYYFGTRIFNMTVRVCANGRNDSCTTAPLQLTVLKAPNPPSFDADPVSGSFDSYLRFTKENVVNGTSILPAVTAYTPEPNPLIYSIIFGDQEGVFNINNRTGLLSVRKPINYEVLNEYNIIVQAKDSVYTNLTASVPVTIRVNDTNDAPVAPAVQILQVIENAALTGNVVGGVIATDEDTWDTLNYTLVAGPHSTFNLDLQSGRLRFTRSLAYNPETAPIYVINGMQTRETFAFDVKVTDTTGASVTTNVVIYIIANVTVADKPVLTGVELPPGGLRTSGGDIIVLRGKNLDSIEALSGSNTKIYVNYTSQVGDMTNRTYITVNCSVVASDTAQCTSVAGYGGGLVIQARWGNTRQVMLTTEALIISYRAPSVTAICSNCYQADGDRLNVPTEGGMVLRLAGADFGPDRRLVTVLYGKNFEYRAQINSVDLTAVTGYNSHRQIYFSTVEGVGTELPIKVIVGGLETVANVTAGLFLSYARPVVTSLTVPIGSLYGTNNLTTNGGETFYVNGRNFGPLSSPAVVRYYVNTTSVVNNVSVPGLLYSFVATCRKADPISAHTYLVCSAAPGVGTNLVVVVTVAGQISVVQPSIAVSYMPPKVTILSGPGSRLADTIGGQEVYIIGQNLGPVSMGDGTVGALTKPPLSITYGITGTEYVAESCRVTSTVPNVITCLTAPGTGKDHVWRVVTGGQGGQPSTLTTSYAPPVVSLFTRTDINPSTNLPFGVNEYATRGGELVIITGRNFGGSLVPGKFDFKYEVILRDPTTDFNSTLGDSDGKIIYLPNNCVMTVPHTELQCYTVAGAGADLQWIMTIDSQPSTFPVTGYAKPIINTVEAINGMPITDASTDGGAVVYLRGQNFGPRVNCRTVNSQTRCMGYVQAVRYGLTGTEYLALNFDVQSHNLIIVFLGPGFGQNLHFSVRVADQDSGPSLMQFSYALPSVISITPSSAATNPTVDNPTTITIRGKDFALLDSQAQVGVLFGNLADGTRSELLPIQSATPLWSNPSQVAAHVPGDDHVLTFLLPQGLGVDRGVRVVVYPRGQPGAYRVTSDPVVDVSRGRSPVFNYIAPRIDAVVVQTPEALRTNGTGVQDFINANFDMSTNPQIYVLTLLGNNFGPWQKLTADNVERRIEGRPIGLADNDPSGFSTANFVVYSWTHKEVRVFTSRSSGTIRVNEVGYSYDDVTRTSQLSNVVTYVDLSPEVGNLVGSSGPFHTAGGEIITFTLKHLLSLRGSLTASVAGRDCPIIDTSDNVVLPADIKQQIVLNNAYYTTPGPNPAAITPDTTWTLRCVLPEGEGTGNPLVIRRDDDGSNTNVVIDYLPPVITTFSVQQEDGSWMDTTFVAGASDTMFVPNDGTVVRINGAEFGLCPVIWMGEGPALQLGDPAVCTRPRGVPVNGTSVNTHSFLEFTAVAGDGQGLSLAPSTGYTLFIDVAGQTTDRSSRQVLKFRYLPPTVSFITPEGRTAGGDVITINGKNLGVKRVPVVTIGPSLCTDVLSISSTALTCVLAEGSGKEHDVTVEVSDQSVTVPHGFFYSLPLVDRIVVDGVEGNVSAARGASTGGYLVDLIGDNFGIDDNTKHCLFAAWRGRDLAQSLQCNDQIDFHGEGEIAKLAIVSWNHTVVSFIMPPGVGARDVVTRVAGQEPIVAPIMRYNTPAITAELSPNHGGTNGGDIITITGADFGQASLDTSDPASVAAMFPSRLPTNLDDYLKKRTPPTAQMSVTFFKTCLSEALMLDGSVPPSVLSCTRGSINTHSHKQIKFASAGGVGVNRSVYVTIYDREFDRANPTAAAVDLVLTSNIVLFHYDPPVVTASNPRPVLQAGDGAENVVTLRGRNFGSRYLQNLQGWTADERRVAVSVGGAPVVNVDRITRYGEDLLELTIADTTVGYKNISYTVAGQQGFTNYTEYAAIFMACLGGITNYRIDDMGPHEGTFGRPGETCVTCPLGAVCPGFDTNARYGVQAQRDGGTHTYPIPIIGWYNLNDTMYEACPEQIAGNYPGRDVCIVPCDPPEACLGDNYCNEAYKSVEPYFRCATCADGFYKRANECIRCPDSPWALVIGFVLLVAIIAGVAYTLNKMKINLAFISIGVDYFQVLAIFATSKVAWPPAIKELFHILSAFNLNIEIVAPECIVPNLAYKNKWLFIMALPLSLAIFFGLLTGGVVFYKTIIMGKKVRMSDQSAALASSVLLLMYVLYIYITRNVLDMFNCSPTEPPDGKRYLSAVFEECGKKGGTQMTLMPAAIVAALVYVAGYPASVAYFLWRFRETVMEDQLLRAKGTGDDRLSNPHAYQLRKRFSRVYYQFKPDLLFWTLCIVFRKFCIAATYILFNKNPAFQLAAALLVMFCAYAAQVKFYPYMSPGDMEEVIKDHERRAFTSALHARLRATIAGIQTRGRRRVKKNLLNKEGKVDTAALLGVLRNWLFNYNTVEEILLFSACIVCLMGIMYGAQGKKSTFYADARDAVTAVVMTVVIVSIIYYLVVVITEITVMAGETNRRKAAAKQAAKDKVSGKQTPELKKKKSMTEEEFNVGDVASAMNPMFLQKGAGNGGDGGPEMGMSTATTQAADAIRAMREPPGSVELWSIYQTTYSELLDRVTAMRNQLSGYSPEVLKMVESKMREDAEANAAAAAASPSSTPMSTPALGPASPSSMALESPSGFRSNPLQVAGRGKGDESGRSSKGR